MCVWTCSVQDNPLYSDIHVHKPTGSHSRAVLFYSWDLLIHYQAWLETCEPICFFFFILCWRLISAVAHVGRCHVSNCLSWPCFSGDPHFLFVACFFWRSSPVWWFFASWLGNIHHVVPALRLFVSSLDFRTRRRSRVPVFCKLILVQFLHSFCPSLSVFHR